MAENTPAMAPAAAPTIMLPAAPNPAPALDRVMARQRYQHLQQSIEIIRKKQNEGEKRAALGIVHKKLDDLHRELQTRINDLKTKLKKGEGTSDVRELSDLEETHKAVALTKRDVELEDNKLKGTAKGLAWIGDKLGVVASYIADGAEVIWKYTLGPALSGLGSISERPRMAIAEWLRTSKIPGGAFIASLLHRGAVTLTPDQQKEKDFDTLTSLFSNNGMTLTLNADTTAKLGMVVELDALLSQYKDKTGLTTTTREGYALSVIGALKVKTITNLTWQDFTKAANALNTTAQRVYAPAGYVQPTVAPAPAPAASTTPLKP